MTTPDPATPHIAIDPTTPATTIDPTRIDPATPDCPPADVLANVRRHPIRRATETATATFATRLVRILGWVAAVAAALAAPTPNPERHVRLGGQRGQATTEYALVLLAAALVALLVVAWAPAGGGAAKIAGLFNRVIDAVTSRV